MTLRHSSQAEKAEEAEKSEQASISRNESEKSQEAEIAQVSESLSFHWYDLLGLYLFAIVLAGSSVRAITGRQRPRAALSHP